jgi:hypothetical protein
MRLNKTRTFLAALTLVMVSLPLAAQRGDDADRASKNGSTVGKVDGVDIGVSYGRPQVKDREVWGALVPNGQVWRTGANEATTIEFSGDVMIEGEALLAGKYGLFTIPGESEWTVIFNKVPQQWGAFNYDANEDALRVTVEPGECEHVESMDFLIDGSNVTVRWAETAVSFEVAGG